MHSEPQLPVSERFLWYYCVVSSGGGRVSMITWEALVNDYDFLLRLLFPKSPLKGHMAPVTIQMEIVQGRTEQILSVVSLSPFHPDSS